jgi:hypothetical protein
MAVPASPYITKMIYNEAKQSFEVEGSYADIMHTLQVI